MSFKADQKKKSFMTSNNNQMAIDEKLIESSNVIKSEKICNVITNLLMNNSLNNSTLLPAENHLIEFQEKKKIQTFKNNLNENQETKFSVLQLKEKLENLETHKKCFFVLSDEIKDEEDEVSIKLKRDILVSKLMWDKTIITEKKLASTYEESLLTSTFLTLSNASRKTLIDNYSDTNLQGSFNFHNLIEFDKLEEINPINFNPATNESILNICERFLKLDESESKVELANDNDIDIIKSETKPKSKSPYLEKLVVEKKDSDHQIEIQSVNRVDITDKLMEEEEKFDESNLHFFKEFIRNNENHPIKDKVEKILNIFNSEKYSNKKSKITNKTKNEILKSLKSEYMTKLEEINKFEEEKRKENELRERLKKEVRGEIIKEEQEKRIQERIKRELEDQLPIWIKKGYDKEKIISHRKDLIKSILESLKTPKLKNNEEIKEKIHMEISLHPLTTNDLNMKTENVNDGPNSYDRRKENISIKNKTSISTEKEKISPERIVNPFVENLENQARLNIKKNKNKFYTEETNASHDANEKVIYTNKGWGIFDYKKFQSKLSVGVVKKANEPKISSKNTNNEKINEKSNNINLGNLMKKFTNAKKILDLGNQKIIYPDKNKSKIDVINNNNFMKHNRKKSNDFWIGNKFEDSDENGEWSEI